MSALSQKIFMCAITFGSAALVSAVLTVLARNADRARGWTCKGPITERDIHSCATPRIGGLAIAAAVVGVMIVFRQFAATKIGDSEWSWSHLLYLLGPGIFIFAVGLYDDVYRLSAPAKLFAEIGTAVVLFIGGYRVYSLPLLFGSADLGTVTSLAITVFWVVLITNSFNLIDGIDGLSAGTAWISVMVLFTVAAWGRHDMVSVIAAALAGALVGFLPFNFNPASVFLGDCGSLFVGFMLSALALASTEKAVVAFAVPVVACAVPLLDTSLAVIRRFLNNKPLFAADRDHIHHKLLDKGLSQRQAVLLLYGVSALFGFLSLALLRRTNSTLAFVLVVAGVVMALGIRRLGYHEIDELHMATRRTIQQRKTIANNLAVRRAISSLKTADSLPQICAALDAVCKQSDFENFEIFLEGQNGFQDEAYLAPFRRERGGLRFTCSKQSNVLRPWNVSAGWKVQLDLVSDHHRHGSFTAYRPYDTAAVSIEMNLLVADFRVALANAIERASYLSRCRAA